MVLRLLWGSPFGNFFLTSKPYPAEAVDALASYGSVLAGHLYVGAYVHALEDAFSSMATAIEGTIQQILKTHSQFKEDAFYSEAMALEGTIQQILKTHSQFKEDAFYSEAIAITGTIRQILITHNQNKEDGMFSTAQVIAGTLV